MDANAPAAGAAALSTFCFPTLIRFGPGAVRELPETLRALGASRPLVVTDDGLALTPLFADVTGLLRAAGPPFEVYSRVTPDPTPRVVEEGAAEFLRLGCDAVVGVGGGSALDAAKAIRLLATHPGSILDYDEARGGTDRITAKLPPLVAIPTTAGTGSEVGRSAVVSDPATRQKRIVFSPHLIATRVLADPALTLGLPPKLTAATGMDALTHCIESFLATGYHPLCDAVALHGASLIARSLRTAYAHGSDLGARTDMLAAAMMGAVAFQKGLGATHSLAHPLSTVAGLHHGLANAVCLPHVLRFNLPAAEGRLAELARHLGESADPLAAIGFVEALCRDVGIPRRLRDAGVTEAQIPEMARLASVDGCHQTNPRPCRPEDFVKLYREAL